MSKHNRTIQRLYDVYYNIFNNYFLNFLIYIIPFDNIRKLFFFLAGMKIGRKTKINMFQHIILARKITIGSNTHINRYCLLDGRGQLTIGNSVSISFGVKIITGSHEIQSSTFDLVNKPIIIGNHVWIGANAVILPGVIIGEGAVIASGAVVTKNVEAFSITAGIPAKEIGKRNKDLDYNCTWNQFFV